MNRMKCMLIYPHSPNLVSGQALREPSSSFPQSDRPAIIGSNDTRLHNTVGRFMIKAPWPWIFAIDLLKIKGQTPSGIQNINKIEFAVP